MNNLAILSTLPPELISQIIRYTFDPTTTLIAESEVKKRNKALKPFLRISQTWRSVVQEELLQIVYLHEYNIQAFTDVLELRAGGEIRVRKVVLRSITADQLREVLDLCHNIRSIQAIKIKGALRMSDFMVLEELSNLHLFHCDSLEEEGDILLFSNVRNLTLVQVSELNSENFTPTSFPALRALAIDEGDNTEDEIDAFSVTAVKQLHHQLQGLAVFPTSINPIILKSMNLLKVITLGKYDSFEWYEELSDSLCQAISFLPSTIQVIHIPYSTRVGEVYNPLFLRAPQQNSLPHLQAVVLGEVRTISRNDVVQSWPPIKSSRKRAAAKRVREMILKHESREIEIQWAEGRRKLQDKKDGMYTDGMATTVFWDLMSDLDNVKKFENLV